VSNELVVPDALAGERVDRALALLTGWSRAEVARLVEDDDVLVGGKPVAKGRKLVGGEIVELLAEPPLPVAPAAEPVPVDTAYVDADIAVVRKPPGLVVHPGAGHADGTLVNGLLERFPEIATVGDPARPGIVHRLDRDTSGLLVVARTQRAYDGLVDALARHAIERVYLALVWGALDAPRGVIDAPIARSQTRRTRMAVRDQGREARTGFEVLEEFTAPVVSLLECRLETGRTHQIRVHLSAIGHPVVGDGAYGGARAGLPLDRPFLHATRLVFDHPVTGARVEVDDPLPADLMAVLTALAAGGG
jgi:23S rRNA pseudouridine1911/1915/1917 synthase